MGGRPFALCARSATVTTRSCADGGIRIWTGAACGRVLPSAAGPARCARPFLSAEDLHLTASVFSAGHQLALLISDSIGGSTASLYGWSEGLVVARDFHVISRKERPIPRRSPTDASAPGARKPAGVGRGRPPRCPRSSTSRRRARRDVRRRRHDRPDPVDADRPHARRPAHGGAGPARTARAHGAAHGAAVASRVLPARGRDPDRTPRHGAPWRRRDGSSPSPTTSRSPTCCRGRRCSSTARATSSPGGHPTASRRSGETASFERTTSGWPLRAPLARRRVVVDAAGTLDVSALVSGDRVRLGSRRVDGFREARASARSTSSSSTTYRGHGARAWADRARHWPPCSPRSPRPSSLRSGPRPTASRAGGRSCWSGPQAAGRR